MKALRGLRPWRTFSVYDLEWVPGTLQVRIVGCFDGARYVSYASVNDFLDAQLTPTNSGRWYYAHAGGLYDVQFLFERLVQNERYYTTAVFSGSSAIIVDVQHGKYRWRFLDSFWLIRESLAKIGNWLGMPKGGPTDDMDERQRKHWYTTIPLDILEEYNEQDCRILWNAISYFELQLLDLGGQLRATLASTALDLFRRAYLKNELPVNSTVNVWSREAYIASRVENAQREVDSCKYYDINSSFPASMTLPLPGDLREVVNGRLPVGELYLADVEVEVPDSYTPPLPYRVKQRIFFPTGRWRARMFWQDVECLLAAGGRIHSVYDVLVFEPFNDLAEYARDMFSRRGKTGGFESQVYKFLGNTLYGKFAEQSEKQIVHVNPPRHILDRLRVSAELSQDGFVPRTNRMLFPGVWVETRELQIEHEHVQLSAAITAWSRYALYLYLSEAPTWYYCDTDGFAVPPETIYPTGNGLGDLKLEKTPDAPSQFIAPKVYHLGFSDKSQDIYRAKGFSLGKHPGDRFEALVRDREITIERMARLKEHLNRGIILPAESLMRKRLQEQVIPKRHFFKDGTSRPWSVAEINTKLERG